MNHKSVPENMTLNKSFIRRQVETAHIRAAALSWVGTLALP